MSKKLFIDFRNSHPVQNLNSGIAASGADNSVNFVQFGPGGPGLELQYQATCTLFGWTKAAAGLTVPGDASDGEGIELIPSILSSSDLPGMFKVGTDAAFRMFAELQVSDKAAYDVCAVGFRKAAAYGNVTQASELITVYEDVAFLNVNAGDVYTATRLAGGVGTATDTTDNVANATNVKLEVLVSAAGVVSFKINDAAPTVNTNTITFAAGTILAPCILITHTATAGTCTLKKFYADLQ